MTNTNGMEFNIIYNGSSLSNSSSNQTSGGKCSNPSTEAIIMVGFTFLFCLLGFVGNGIVVWLLKFRIKGNPFTTYILNLSISDLGVVTAIVMLDVNWAVCHSSYEDIRSYLSIFFLLMYSACQFLLTFISIDRCVSVFFPVWHMMHRPKNLPTTICVIIWVLAFLFAGIHLYLLKRDKDNYFMCLEYLVIAVLCIFLMSVSTISLFIKVYLRPWQGKQRRLLTAILLALVFFLLLAIPMDIVQYNGLRDYDSYALEYPFLCSSLNSCINPLIYFLVGRWGRRGSSHRMKAILEEVLKDESKCIGGPASTD